MSFKVGTGADDVKEHAICDQFQQSAWDIRAQYDPAKDQTSFTKDDGTGIAKIQAAAEIPDPKAKPGTSKSTTSFKLKTLTVNPITASIGSDGTKDDASAITTAIGEVAEAAGQLLFTLDDAPVIDVRTSLVARDGASATIIDGDGLRLLVDPGEIATFSVIAENYYDPSQSFAWNVGYDGVALTGVGVDLGDFVAVTGGYLLPFSLMPGHDLTATLAAGEVAFTGVANAIVAVGPDLPHAALVLGPALLLLLRQGRRMTLPASGTRAPGARRSFG